MQDYSIDRMRTIEQLQAQQDVAMLYSKVEAKKRKKLEPAKEHNPIPPEFKMLEEVEMLKMKEESLFQEK